MANGWQDLIWVWEKADIVQILLCARKKVHNKVNSAFLSKAPSTRMRIFFNSRYGYRAHASDEFDSESGYFKIRSPEWKKITTNPITCGRVNPDIFESMTYQIRVQSLTEKLKLGGTKLEEKYI